MTDSRAKGQRAEYAVRDLLRDSTGLEWDRVPGSGGFGQSHGLKGDIYLPPPTGVLSAFTIEVKHYADDVISTNIFNSTVSQLEKFWEQTCREAEQMKAKPLLIFKKDRGKWIAGIRRCDLPEKLNYSCMVDLSKNNTQFVMVLFEELLTNTTKEFWVK